MSLAITIVYFDGSNNETGRRVVTDQAHIRSAMRVARDPDVRGPGYRTWRWRNALATLRLGEKDAPTVNYSRGAA